MTFTFSALCVSSLYEDTVAFTVYLANYLLIESF